MHLELELCTLSYTLYCVGKPGLVQKDKQLEALKYSYAQSDVFSTGYFAFRRSVSYHKTNHIP